ncbi:hypothetical protein P280DRAFT_465281 [Massarina eburnea CBS 473.64]|uniref:Acyltransferase 3 domain-containing protein n=1 Tax=Massarina eburnea CBS 473.64 TaxID=1395130 RepID=A0A6A6SG77_9PLEO|nr:hypothetical protein P280DRAFT_465281 [Massarina eburnea CBS 473.64]
MSGTPSASSPPKQTIFRKQPIIVILCCKPHSHFRAVDLWHFPDPPLTIAKGLRGLASVTVVLSHLSRAFVGEVFAAATDDQPPVWYQLPYVRLLFQGRLGVSVFALVTGYVCALKPIKLYRQDNPEAAFAAISKSALRRFPRLFFPAAIATCLVWLLVETGLYTIAKHTDSFYLDVMSQPRIGNLGAALTKLVQEIAATWTKRKNDYDSAQWTMLPLLQESTAIYVFLVATAYIRSRFRMLCALGMVVFYWLSSDGLFGILGFFGIFLAEFQMDDFTNAFIGSQPIIAAVVSTFNILLGGWFASYPEANMEALAWSRNLHAFYVAILPPNPDIGHFSSSFGLMFIAFGIVLSPFLQKALSSKYLLFFGRMSFAVYLLHHSMMKTVLAWMLYGVHTKPAHMNDKNQPEITRLEYPGHPTLLMWCIVWWPMLYGVAYLWTQHVDPRCERLANKLVEWMKLDSGKQSNGYLPMAPLPPPQQQQSA